MTTELKYFVFKDTGISIQIRKVSPLLAVDIDESIPRPTPPLNKVDYGDGRGEVMEPNLSDPSYNKALEKRQTEVGLAVIRATILRSVIVNGEEWKEEVKEYRKFIQDTTGAPLAEENDLYIYITRICVGTQDDLNDLVVAITSRSQPTPEEIAKAKDSFRS